MRKIEASSTTCAGRDCMVCALDRSRPSRLFDDQPRARAQQSCQTRRDLGEAGRDGGVVTWTSCASARAQAANVHRPGSRVDRRSFAARRASAACPCRYRAVRGSRHAGTTVAWVRPARATPTRCRAAGRAARGLQRRKIFLTQVPVIPKITSASLGRGLVLQGAPLPRRFAVCHLASDTGRAISLQVPIP